MVSHQNKEMIVINKIADLEAYVSKSKAAGKRIGLVPTMGALHAGHLSLVERAVKENDVVITSVFVNPTQFNNPNDLATYPRTEEADCRLLEEAGVSVAFVPGVSEMYPNGAKQDKVFELGTAAEVMEGKFRPGHFQGVAQIVSRLFELCRPDKAYFGEKDFQQIAVIRNMVKSEGIEVEIVSCPIKRAEDGLALSSRNALLTPSQRAIAPAIHKAMAEGVKYSETHSVKETHDMIVSQIDSEAEMQTEYLEIVDGETLLEVTEWDAAKSVYGCITVFCGKVRLIDNIRFR